MRNEYIINSGTNSIVFNNVAAVAVILKAWLNEERNQGIADYIESSSDIINSILDTDYIDTDQEILDIAYYLEANPRIANILGLES